MTAAATGMTPGTTWTLIALAVVLGFVLIEADLDPVVAIVVVIGFLGAFTAVLTIGGLAL